MLFVCLSLLCYALASLTSQTSNCAHLYQDNGQGINIAAFLILAQIGFGTWKVGRVLEDRSLVTAAKPQPLATVQLSQAYS
jgi:hypothetical protein